MEQTSKLSIVVDTAKAASQIKAFSSALKQMERDGLSSSKSISKIGGGANFSALNSSINTARASLSGFNATTNNMTAAMNQGARAAAGLRAATKGISTNINAIASASTKISNISGAIDKARISSGKLGTVVRDVNKNVLTLNSTLNTATATMDRFSQSAVTGGQRLGIFGRAATQVQTRLNGLSGNLSSVRSDMTSLASAANNINAIFGNLDRTMARLATATDRLNTATTRANAQINLLERNFGQANRSGRGLMGTLSSIQGILAGGLFTVSGLGILRTADEMQNLNSQIRIVTKSEEELLGVRERIRAIADQNFNDVAATTDLYTKSARALSNLGKSQQEALVFTDAVSLAMRTGGRSAQEQSSAILQLSQAMSSGILAGDELRSISENAPILLELIAKRMGVLPGQLKELGSEGKITAEIMYDAFSQNINILEDMATKIPLTMGQAFVRAKNQYKKYVDGIMNDTGGASSVIAGFITDIGNNFDTLAKVAIAGVGLAFAQLALSIGTATAAMTLFNIVTSANPLILVATGFIAVSSAIYGTNEVLTLSGVMIKDLIGELGDMANFLGNTWDDVSDWIMENVLQIEKAIGDSNDKNRKSYFGFYEETEKGFAGLVQRIMGNVASVSALITSVMSYLDRLITNIYTSIDNLVTAFSNLYKMVGNMFGGDAKLGDFKNYQVLDIVQIYRNQNSANQDVVANYVRGANQRAGLADPVYSNPLRSRYFKGGFSDLMTAGANSVLKPKTSIPANLRAPNSQISNEPMDLIKKQQHDELKAQEAITAAKEERAKLEKGLNNRLVGISGDTGVGNAHLHIQYRDKSRPVSAADLARFKAGNKAITDYPMTSGFGKRNTGIKGASTNHRGTDFGIPKNTPITTNVAVKSVKTWKDSKGGGYVSTITFEDGVVIDLLHQMPSVMGVEKGSSTGNKQIDSMIGKAESNVAKAAAKAERERIKAAEEAQKEQERIADLRLKLIKDYGNKELQLNVENDERIAEIKDAGFNGTKQDELIKESERRMNQELAIYKKGLDDKINELVSFQKTERELLKKQYDDDVFGLVSDPELSRPENKAQLKQAIENARLLNEYRVSLYEQSLEQQKSAMYAFQKTERQIVVDGWNERLSEAKLQYDELRDYRIEAIKAEGQRDIDMFDTNQALKLLELKKAYLTETQYLKAKYDLERKLANIGSEDPDVKRAQDIEAKRAFDEAQQEIKDRVSGDYLKQTQSLFGISSDLTDLKSAWQDQLDVAGKAFDEGVIQLEEYHQRMTDLDAAYMNKKQGIIVGGYETAFGLAAGVMKAFGGEQSGIYRAIFAVEKAFAFSRILLENKVALAKAWSSAPFPYNLPAVATTAMQTGVLAAGVEVLSPIGFKAGGYTGNMGVNQVAGAVHGQEYVFDAQSTKRIGVDNLNAMRRGDSVGGDVNITVNNMSSARVETQKDDNGNIIMTIRDEVKKSWLQLQNPNSHPSKMIKASVQAPRRR